MSKKKTLKIIVGAGVLIALGLFGYGVVAERSTPTSLPNPLAQAPVAPPHSATTTLLFTGDIMLSRGVAQMSEIHGGGSPHYPFSLITETLRRADLTIGNLEGPISARGTNQGGTYSFRAEPKMADGLAFAGFDILALANNHIWDWGVEALIDTPRILKERGIATVGAGVNTQEANTPYITEVNGTTFAFLSYTNLMPSSFTAGTSTPGISNPNLETLTSNISNLKSNNDIVVILWHWGEEYQTSANQRQKEIASQLVDAGADLIVGTHPHVTQEVEEVQDNKWAAYSLGNFIFDQGFSAQTMRGTMLQVEVVRREIDAVSPVPVSLAAHFQPYVGGQTEPFLEIRPFKKLSPPVTLSEGFAAYDGALQDTPGALHRGIDYIRKEDGEFLPFGVYAMHSGEALQGESNTWGNYVLVRTARKQAIRPYTIYAHLENIPSTIPKIIPSILGVQQGRNVTAGTYLGDAGTTGNTKGIPQLHIELHEEDVVADTTRKLDPYNIYDRASSGRYPQPGEGLPDIRHYWVTSTPPFAK